MTKKDKHVVKNGSMWSVKEAGEVVSNHRTQANAIKAGKAAAKNDKSDLVIHGTDGKIRSKDSYGNDPKRPKDKEH